MQKFLATIDWVLLFRLLMSVSMIIVGYQSSDNLPMVFGGCFAVYALIASKYKVGCGYQGSCGIPHQFEFKSGKNTTREEVEFKEVK